MGSWDRMVIPHPFSAAVFIYGDPIYVERDEDVEQARRRVETAMNALASRAENFWQS
jgi:lysophospholipid acyltransferase (LPLAT)-like uncharacterized protein